MLWTEVRIPPLTLFFVAANVLHLNQFAGGLGRLELLIRKSEEHFRQLLQGFQLLRQPVRLDALGEAVGKKV